MSEMIDVTLTLSDQVAQALLDQIKSGNLKPGAKMPSEADLAPTLGVSQAVVHEAFSRLKLKGVLDGQPGNGVYITARAGIKPLELGATVLNSPEAVLHIVEVRRAVESEVAAVAAQRHTAVQLAKLEDALTAIDTEVKNGGDGVLPDVAFHRAIAEATGNPYFMGTLDFLAQYLTTATRITRANEARRSDFSTQVRDEHRAILEAIRRRDAVAARGAAQTHMLNAARRLLVGRTVFN